MSRTALIVTVLLATYALVSFVVALVGAFVGRALVRRGHRLRARTSFWLRAAAPLAGGLFSLGVVGPAFHVHEPFYQAEQPGPVIVGFAVLGVATWSASLARLARAAWARWRFDRAWRRLGDMRAVPGASLPFHVIDTSTPLVGLVGVLRPHLVMSSGIFNLCSASELAAIGAHEAAHLAARDNVKRLFFDTCPDALRWTPMHHWLVGPWAAAAEDEADDRATGSTPHARLLLAGLLVRLARLAPDRGPVPQASSPFVADDVERRVRRLVDAPARPGASPSPHWNAIATASILASIAVTTATPAMMAAVHSAVESLVSLWR